MEEDGGGSRNDYKGTLGQHMQKEQNVHDKAVKDIVFPAFES